MKDLRDWVKRLGQWHYSEGGANETLCGMPMLGNNYAREIPAPDREPCKECFKKADRDPNDLLEQIFDLKNPRKKGSISDKLYKVASSLKSASDDFGQSDFWQIARKHFGADWEDYGKYSGRGMYGKYTDSALTTSYPPNSSEGKAFMKATGASVDNMGMDYIYYLRTASAKTAGTYAEAQQKILDVLKNDGWSVSDHLKIPHATKDGIRLWFKPQSIYFSRGNNFKDALSLWLDPKKLSELDPKVISKGLYQKANNWGK